jgi:glucose-1-phosphate thymidylyltransferase
MRTVIIPAAGLATRMKPLSNGVSKAMIPVNGRPLISYIIEHLEKSKTKFSEYIIVENELGDIRKFLKRVYPQLNFKFVTQRDKKGPLHAIMLGADASEQPGPVTVWLGDTICLDEFDYNNDFLAVNKVDDPQRWCLIDHNGKLYDKLSDPPTNLALIGVYNFTSRDIFVDSVKRGMICPTHKGEHQIAELLTEYARLSKLNWGDYLIEAQYWYDCGELNSYYESKARLLNRSARAFNKIEVNTFFGTITKTSDTEIKKEKIEQEKKWFKSLNKFQSLFCPRVLDSDYGVLEMSLEPGVALNEVLVYDNLRLDVWREIIRKIIKVHHSIFLCKDSNLENLNVNDVCYRNYYQRNADRLATIFKQVKISQEQQQLVNTFFENTATELSKNPNWSGVIHGDSHLANIIYDAYSGNIKFVDPRGSFGDIVGTAGDMRYDMGKLLQDFYCGYSMLIADRYKIVKKDNQEVVEINWVENSKELHLFLKELLNELGYDTELLERLAILLLLTAIPFHSDDPNRQRAFLIRCINLIKEKNLSK